MKTQKPKQSVTLSADPVQRMEEVGKTLFGPRGWAGQLAVKLGMGRATVYAWKARRFDPPANLDELLLTLVERQRENIAAYYSQLDARLVATAAALKQKMAGR